VEADNLQLCSSTSSTPLKYDGYADQWQYCKDDFDVRMQIEYKADSNTIEGEIEVDPCREVEYGPPCAYGGGYSFTGTRVQK